MSERPVISVEARSGVARGEVTTETGAAELDRLVQRAVDVFTRWSRWSRAERAEVLEAIADALDARRDELVPLADEETALGEARLVGEVGRTSGQLRFFATVIRDGAYLGATIDHARPDLTSPRPDLRRWSVPIGPVAVFAASNFPFAFSVLGGDTAAALAAGCAVIVKAHPSHPATSQRVFDIAAGVLAEHGLDGLLALVHGHDAGVKLVEHASIRAVAFTGSTAGGRALADRCAARPEPIPFFGELGSINPVVVTPAAAGERAEAIGQGLVGSATLGAGQFCTKPGLWLVPAGDDGDRLVGAAAEAVDSLGSFTMLNDGIRSSFAAGGAERAGREAVAVRAGGTSDGDARAVRSVLFEVDAATFDDALAEECFGPTAVIVRYAGEAERDALVERLPGSLTATIHRGAGEEVGALADALAARTGRVVFDGYPTGVAVTWAITHGGPWPSTNTTTTSVGSEAIARFVRPVSYQDAPVEVLPPELHDGEPTVPTRINGVLTLPAR